MIQSHTESANAVKMGTKTKKHFTLSLSQLAAAGRSSSVCVCALVVSGRFTASAVDRHFPFGDSSTMWLFARQLLKSEDRAPTNAKMECEICLKVYDRQESVSCARGHSFCETCFRAYANEAILGMYKSILPCMALRCGEMYSEETAKRWLSEALYRKLQGNGEECANDEAKRSEPLTAEDRERLEREEHLTERAIRRCPGCTKAILKEGGCNHVACPSCGTHMCYRCGVRVEENDYGHRCGISRRPRLATTQPMFQNPIDFPARPWLPTPDRQQHDEESGFGVTFTSGVAFRAFSEWRSPFKDRPTDAAYLELEPTAVEKRLSEAISLTRVFRNTKMVMNFCDESEKERKR